ncbi:unnamed protein product [Mytilus coruscus]|uniref:Uncharacterized protein n=1 Tax=Mytilus coruscus TaxID=42192 RepID=A0A6J8E2B8_MYTCO|nr:unnamed protein product [Mytilus coruscus]
METEDTQPGFTNLRLLHRDDRKNFRICDEIGNDFFFPNSTLKERYLTNHLPTIHGPCLSNGILDLAICVHNRSWITPANEWIARISNTSWPGYDMSTTFELLIDTKRAIREVLVINVESTSNMAEIPTQSDSLALYKYLCQNIVGTEEHVKTCRLMNTVRDNLQSDKQWTVITSGSFGEGIEMQGSDVDLVRVKKNIEVCENTNIHYNPAIIYFAMETNDTHPGYTQLRLVHSCYPTILQTCRRRGSNYYYSNSLYKQQFVEDLFSTVHGPCISDNHELNKRYNAALCVLKYTLSKCTREKLSKIVNLLDIDYELEALLNLPLFKKMNIVQLKNILVLDNVIFLKNSALVPDELDIDVHMMGTFHIPPVVYAHFLTFLCYYHLNNTRQCKICLRKLQSTVRKRNFIPNEYFDAISYLILGITFQLSGDIESARHAFRQSVRLEPRERLNTSLWRLSLIR